MERKLVRKVTTLLLDNDLELHFVEVCKGFMSSKCKKKKKKAKSWCLETAPKVKEFMYRPLIRALSHNRGILNIVEIKTKALFKDQELFLISLNFGHACDKSKFEIIFNYRTPARLYDWSFYILVTAPEMAIPSILNIFLIYLQRYQHFHMHWVVQYQWKLSSVTMFTWGFMEMCSFD